MEIIDVDYNEYSAIVNEPYTIFGSALFNDINRSKCEEVYYLLFKEGKYRLGIIGGRMGGTFKSPFSAPFGGFSYVTDTVRIQYVEEAVRKLKDWAKLHNCESIILTLPPLIYNEDFITKQISSLWREGFALRSIDLNYSYNLKNFNVSYREGLWHNARKNLKIALEAGLEFKKCSCPNEMMLAYEIISKNRQSHGYALRLSWEQISETINIIPADFFIVSRNDLTPISSAIVFHVNKTIVQVIYWGDLPGFSELKPMNYLSYKLFEYYANKNKSWIDIGPASENSVPNYGLIEFKESIGSVTNAKYTFSAALR